MKILWSFGVNTILQITSLSLSDLFPSRKIINININTASSVYIFNEIFLYFGIIKDTYHIHEEARVFKKKWEKIRHKINTKNDK